MKCEIQFPRKNKKSIINLSSVELAMGLVKVNIDITTLEWPLLQTKKYNDFLISP